MRKNTHNGKLRMGLSFSLILHIPKGWQPYWLWPRADHRRRRPALTKCIPPLSLPSMVTTTDPGISVPGSFSRSPLSRLVVASTRYSHTA